MLDRVASSPIDAVMLQYNASDFRLVPQILRLNAAGKVIISGTALGRAKFKLATFLPRNRKALWYLLRMLRDEPAALGQAKRLEAVLAGTGKPATDAAIQFVTGRPEILSNLFGTTNVEHARQNVRAAHGALTRKQWEVIEQSSPAVTSSQDRK